MEKIKKVKQAMKELNKAEYNVVGVKVKEYRQKLIEVQEHVSDLGQNRQLIEDEKAAKLQLEKWSRIEESIMKQKSRIKWLQLGDANTAYFFASMKSRCSQNKIRRLIKSDGNSVHTKKDIE